MAQSGERLGRFPPWSRALNGRNTHARAFPLVGYLVALALVVAVPLALLSGWYLTRLHADAQAATERRIERNVETIATRVAARLQDMILMTRVMAEAPELDKGQFAELHARTRSALFSGPWHMIVVDKNGQQLLNTRVPFGTPLGATSNMAVFEQALKAEKPVVSNAFFGKTSGKWVFNVIKAVDLAPPLGRGAVILTQNADEFAADLEGVGLPSGWQTVLVDSSSVVLAANGTTQDGETFKLDAIGDMKGPSGTFGTKRGDATSGGYSMVPATGWHVVVFGPWSSAFDVNFGSALRTLLLWYAAVIATTMVIAFFLARVINRSLRKLVRMARGIGRGEVVEPVNTPVTELNLLADTLSDAAVRRREAERREATVRGELVHRVKNLFSVVQSVLNLSARGARSASELRADLSGRIGGLGRSIDLLAASQWQGVPLQALVEQQLGTFVDTAARTAISGPPMQVRAEAVQALGMALHELATNATKYGALSGPDGRVVVNWTLVDNETGPQFRLEWREEQGPAVPASVAEGFGSRIIRDNVAVTMDAEVTLDIGGAGLQWTVVAPVENVLEHGAGPVL